MAFNYIFTFDHFYFDPFYRRCEGLAYFAVYKWFDLQHKFWNMYSL